MTAKKILIVDDDGKNIFALAAVLRNKGFVPVTATDVEQGLSILRTHGDIGIVLSDIMMPGQDGFDFIRLVRQDPQLKKLPVIAVTAKAMAGDKQKCLEAGADDYVSKPVDLDKLISILQKYEIAGSKNNAE